MALNPPLLNNGLPAGLPSEWFCLERNGIELLIETRDATLRKQTLKRARLYLTTQRICVVAEAPNSAGLRSFDIPLAGISNESFEQPIFGCNYLKADVAPLPGGGLGGLNVNDSGQPPRICLYFLDGGAGTFLRVFFTLMAKRRIADARLRDTFFAASEMATWVAAQQAYVDPNDSSRLYLSAQPESQNDTAPFLGGGGGGSLPLTPPSGYSQAR